MSELETWARIRFLDNLNCTPSSNGVQGKVPTSLAMSMSCLQMVLSWCHIINVQIYDFDFGQTKQYTMFWAYGLIQVVTIRSTHWKYNQNDFLIFIQNPFSSIDLSSLTFLLCSSGCTIIPLCFWKELPLILSTWASRLRYTQKEWDEMLMDFTCIW